MNQPTTGVWDCLNAHLSAGDLPGAIATAETALSALPVTEFHTLRSASCLAQRDDLLNWMDAFFTQTSRDNLLGALCLELNASDANVDLWFLHGLAYATNEDWLADQEPIASTAEPFVLRGLEAGQAAFAHYAAADSRLDGALESARDLAAILVELRVQELVAHAHRAAQAQERAWGQVPVAVTAHDSDWVYESPTVGTPTTAPRLEAASAFAPVGGTSPSAGAVSLYYQLTLSSEPKVIGVRNGTMQVEICDESFVAAARLAPLSGTPGFLAAHAKSLAITNLRVLPRAKLTDVLSFGPKLSWFPFLLKRKTWALLSAFHTRVAHVVPVTLDPDPYGLNDYVLVMLPPLEWDCLDYAQSTFYTGSPGLGTYAQQHFANAQEYLTANQTDLVLPAHIVLAPQVDRNLDLFLLAGSLYVSNRLKQTLEREQTTGIKTSDTILPTLKG